MIDNKLLLRNKKIADYALILCKKLGISEKYDGREIYSYLLLFNTGFVGIDFSDKLKLLEAYKHLKFVNKQLFFLESEHRSDHLDRIVDVIYLAILQ